MNQARISENMMQQPVYSGYLFIFTREKMWHVEIAKEYLKKGRISQKACLKTLENKPSQR
uniref:Uncharacterized protein n=1 Tax=Romanomermis culicivorax TaxID=13658 RepID=A0A915HQC7_ROMCU